MALVQLVWRQHKPYRLGIEISLCSKHRIEWAGGDDDPVYMTGPAVEVFTGDISL